MKNNKMIQGGRQRIAGESSVVKKMLAGLLAATGMMGAHAQNVAPTVDMTTPAAGSNFVAPATLTLTAAAADSDGTIASVSFYNGASLLGTATSAPYSFSWKSVGVGSYTITSVATDNAGTATTSAPVAVTVNPNVLPSISVAAPPADANYIGPESIVLTSTATDSDGTIKSVRYYRNGTYLSSVSTAPYALTWKAAAGTHSITAQAEDDKGGKTMSAPVSYFVKQNVLPTVALTPPPENAEYIGPATIVLSATAGDTDGTIKAVHYSRNGSYINSVYSAPYTLNWNANAGTHAVTAQAEDDKGGRTTSAPFTFVVKQNQLPSVALVTPKATDTYIGPVTIVMTATASDPDGTIKNVSYYRNGTYLNTVSTPPYSLNWPSVSAGTYSITARTTDDKGGSATSAPVTIVVKENLLPTVAITSPSSNASFVAPGNVPLQVNVGDTDGDVMKVVYYRDGVAIGTASAAPFSLNWNNVAVGTYSITAKVHDDKGGITTSAAVPISVVANVAPVVSLRTSATPESLFAPAAVPLTAAATDTDGNVTKVEFYKGTTLLGFANTAPFQFNWTNVAAGTYSLVAKAFDDKGGVTTSEALAVTVRTNVGPTVSIATPISSATYYVPGVIELAVNVTDSDGTVSKVEYYNGTTLLAAATAAPFTSTWTSAVAGSYSVTAKATDNLGAVSTSAPVIVTVKTAPLPAVSLITPEPDARFAAPASFLLQASASVTGDTISKVEYISVGTVIGTATTPPYTLSMTNVPAGYYDLRARATGTLGGVASSAVINLTVANNSAPNVTLAATPTSSVAPAVVTLTAQAVDSDGTIAKVEFLHGANVLATVTQAPFTFSWDGVAAGTYAITARATDNLDLVTVSNAVTVTIAAIGAPDNAEVYYIYSDQIHTAREIRNEAGAKVWEADSDAFALNLPNENPSGQGRFVYNRRFPGQYFDSETGLHYNYYRDYDPQTGRYVQSDPIGMEGGINTYGYVGGNPLSLADHFGLQADTISPPRRPPIPGPLDILFPGTTTNDNFVQATWNLLMSASRSTAGTSSETKEKECKCQNKRHPDLFRDGNATGPRLDNVRLGKDIDIVDGKVWPDTGGLSSFSGQPPLKGRWKYPAGLVVPDDLCLWNDHTNHWRWDPRYTMTYLEYLDALGRTQPGWIPTWK